MNTALRHLIFEFTITIYKDGEIELGFLEKQKDKILTKNISVLGFLLGETKKIINNQVIFYN